MRCFALLTPLQTTFPTDVTPRLFGAPSMVNSTVMCRIFQLPPNPSYLAGKWGQRASRFLKNHAHLVCARLTLDVAALF